MINIKFRYLYRDASNYKGWADVVFSNPEAASVEAVQGKLRKTFLGGELFVARQIRLPEVFLFREYPLTEEDHCFHEFYSVEGSGEAVTDEFARSITDFIDDVREQGERGWRTFDPLDPWCEPMASRL